MIEKPECRNFFLFSIAVDFEIVSYLDIILDIVIR